MSQQFHEFDDERRWLGPPARHRRRRLLAGLLVVALTLVWAGLGQRSKVPEPVPARPPSPTTDQQALQQALEAGRRALEAWGRFAVTNHPDTLRRWFWPSGPQYRLLAGEAKLRRGTKPPGPPAYRFTLAPVSVLAPSPRQRILRGRVQVTRPDGRSELYTWDLWMRHDASSSGRWRLWTVKPTHQPRSRSAADPVVVAAGDIAEAGGHHRLTSDRVLELDPDAVLLLGDSQYLSGGAGRLPPPLRPNLGSVQGQDQPGARQPRVPDARRGRLLHLLWQAGQAHGHSYYSLDLGGWHLIALNSSIDHGPRSAQARWLRADLVATAKRCILAYWHYPRFSSGAHQGNHRSVAAFWNHLYHAGADVVLSGHEHSYERFARQTPRAKADRWGLRQFVVGTGGVGLLGFAAPKPNSQVRIGDAHGVLKLVLHPTSYEWRFISEDGAVLDQGGPVACHRGAQTDLPTTDG